MVNFSVAQIREIMEKKHNIRNMSVIAHVDHGKSTLTDSLILAAGMISEKDAGTKRFTDTRDDEAARGITIKSTGVTLLYEIPEGQVPADAQGTAFLVNLIDSPGHVDFSSEVTAALRVTDGALVVVDCVEGVSVQTETVLRQALGERIKPVLMVNKVDRSILELQLDQETAYQSFSRTIESTNAIVATYEDPLLGDVQVDPSVGTVAFGSGLMGWGFTLTRFADMYAKKFGVDRGRMMRKLWGDNYFDPSTKHWVDSSTGSDGTPLKRAFCQFVLDPVYRLFESILANDKEKYEKMLKGLNIVLQGEAKDLQRKDLLKYVLRRFIPLHEALLEMIVTHLPSPAKAQRYRVDNLYEGPMDDECAVAIRDCNPAGPLMVFISKMVPTSDNGRFYAFGRVFSGTVKQGIKVRILGPDHVPGKKNDFKQRSILRAVVMMGRYVEPVEDVPCGNTVAILGVDQDLVKSGTITTSEVAHNIRVLKFSVSPVVRIAVEVTNASDLPKLKEGLTRLSKSDPLVQVVQEEGKTILAGAGELHLEICIKDLREFCGNIDLRTSEPVVPYRESVSAVSSVPCLAKTANKLNRLYMMAQPMGKEATAIEKGDLKVTDADEKKLAKQLAEEFGWDVEAKKLWAWGPEPQQGTCCLVDTSRSVDYLNETRELIVTGFGANVAKGPITEEPLRGVRFNLTDAMLHSETTHRSTSQILPAVRRCMFAAVLTAEPIILEPIFAVDIQCPDSAIGGIFTVLTRRRGHFVSQEQRPGTPLYSVKAFLPVMESFGFTEDLRSQTHGQAFPQCVFDHWQPLPGSPLDSGSKAYQVAMAIRKRKGLKEVLPSLDQYLDKL